MRSVVEWDPRFEPLGQVFLQDTNPKAISGQWQWKRREPWSAPSTYLAK